MRKNKELLKSRNQEEREKQLNLREQKTTRRPKEKQGDGERLWSTIIVNIVSEHKITNSNLSLLNKLSKGSGR